MLPIIWTQEDCPLCARVKSILGEYEERPASDLVSGMEPDLDAMTALAMQNMELPLVKMDGAFVNVHELLESDSAAA